MYMLGNGRDHAVSDIDLDKAGRGGYGGHQDDDHQDDDHKDRQI